MITEYIIVSTTIHDGNKRKKRRGEEGKAHALDARPARSERFRSRARLLLAWIPSDMEAGQVRVCVYPTVARIRPVAME